MKVTLLFLYTPTWTTDSILIALQRTRQSTFEIEHKRLLFTTQHLLHGVIAKSTTIGKTLTSSYLTTCKYLKQNKYTVTLTDTMQQEPHSIIIKVVQDVGMV